MKKIKKIWNENRILIVLAIILVACIIIMGVVALVSFYGSSTSPDGNRYDDLKEFPKQRISEIQNKIKEKDGVSKVDITYDNRKELFVRVEYTSKTEMATAKAICEEAISYFTEEELDVFDIEFTIVSPKDGEFKGYTLMGARNANGSGTVLWNNYTIKDESDEKDNKN